MKEKIEEILLTYLYPQENRVIGFKAYSGKKTEEQQRKLCQKYAKEIANKIVKSISQSQKELLDRLERWAKFTKFNEGQFRKDINDDYGANIIKETINKFLQKSKRKGKSYE